MHCQGRRKKKLNAHARAALSMRVQKGYGGKKKLVKSEITIRIKPICSFWSPPHLMDSQKAFDQNVSQMIDFLLCSLTLGSWALLVKILLKFPFVSFGCCVEFWDWHRLSTDLWRIFLSTRRKSRFHVWEEWDILRVFLHVVVVVNYLFTFSCITIFDPFLSG